VLVEPFEPLVPRLFPTPEITPEVSCDFLEQGHERILRVHCLGRIPTTLLGESRDPPPHLRRDTLGITPPNVLSPKNVEDQALVTHLEHP